MYDIHSMIVLQYDPLVQEVFDQARKLRCTWYDYYEKSVTFRPFQVNMLNAVTANFLGDNLQCWMQIQSGKGPWSSEVSGIVKIGQTMTMVSEYNLEQLRLRISLDKTYKYQQDGIHILTTFYYSGSWDQRRGSKI